MILSCLPLMSGVGSAANAGSDIQVYFSPNGGCTDAVVRELSQAHQSVGVQAYTFTSTAIAQALVQAHDRGVQVVAIIDKSARTEKYTEATFLANHNIPVFIDDQHDIAHNKIMIIDGQTVITGSFNFTKQAEKSNAENLLILHRQDVAKLYTANLQEHLQHSKPYTGPSGDGDSPRDSTRHESRKQPAGN
ncbi:MAG TPA: phospholipase D family protein [Tepidisphaeraceae bacterium]|nr:phospholipase D family protein [Tepidisphaeraceae bacterium]